jgi:hypothetical protein
MFIVGCSVFIDNELRTVNNEPRTMNHELE